MYLEHFWLSVVGIFCSGMLSMLGIMIGIGMHKKDREPRVILNLGFDPRNPINQRSILNQQDQTTNEEIDWHEITGYWN